jgi:hypothetical protein
MTAVPREKEYAVSRQHGRPSPRPQVIPWIGAI